MSDTPRVDAAEIRHGKEGYSYLTVSVEFARQLERELCRLIADNERLRDELRQSTIDITRAEIERLREALALAERLAAGRLAMVEQLTDEVEALRRERA